MPVIRDRAEHGASTDGAGTGNGGTSSAASSIPESAFSSMGSTPEELSRVSVSWEAVTPILRRRCVCMLIAGKTDTGRTALALSAPGPIAYIDLSEKQGEEVKAVRRGKEVKRVFISTKFSGDVSTVQAEATRTATYAEAAIHQAFYSGKFRSVVVDTKDALYSVLELARLGTMIQAERNEKDRKMGQLVRSAITNRFRSMLVNTFRAVSQDRNVNLILVGQLKEEYNGNQATGRFVLPNFKALYDVDVILRTEFEPGKGEYMAKVEKPWINHEMRNQIIKIGEDDLGNALSQIMSAMTDTEIGEWE